MPADAIGNPQLLEAMTAVAKEDSPRTRRTLYRTILDSYLVIPTPELPANVRPGKQILEHSIDMHVLGIPDSNGRMVTQVFTDEEGLREWNPHIEWFGMRATDFLRLVLATPAEQIVFNPYDGSRKPTRPSARLSREEIEALATRKMPGQPN